eukprot:6183489-Pleurochrysis_carterae.AAC.1
MEEKEEWIMRADGERVEHGAAWGLRTVTGSTVRQPERSQSAWRCTLKRAHKSERIGRARPRLFWAGSDLKTSHVRYGKDSATGPCFVIRAIEIVPGQSTSFG